MKVIYLSINKGYAFSTIFCSAIVTLNVANSCYH
jgi:hypothetical protein